MAESEVFVLLIGSKPVGVFFTRRSAENAMSDLSFKSDAHIEMAHLQDLRTWIHSAMQWASLYPPSDRKPVIVPEWNEAFDWAVSEVGEAAGAKVAYARDWSRNNPEKHTGDSFKHEVHQAVMMLILAGGDPIDTIIEQLKKWGYQDAI